MVKKISFAFLFCMMTTSAFATAEYDACYQAAKNDDEVALCMKAETARLLKSIQDMYFQISEHEQTRDWNNGNGLISGNLKDMYNHFIAYRNRYCSLFEKASENTFGSAEFDKERCLLNLTSDHYELMDKILLNANSGGEESDHDDE